MRHGFTFGLVLVAVAGCGGGSGGAGRQTLADGAVGDQQQAADDGGAAGDSSGPGALSCRDNCNITQDRCLAALQCVPNVGGTGTVCPANNCDYDNAVCVAACPPPSP